MILIFLSICCSLGLSGDEARDAQTICRLEIEQLDNILDEFDGADRACVGLKNEQLTKIIQRSDCALSGRLVALGALVHRDDVSGIWQALRPVVARIEEKEQSREDSIVLHDVIHSSRIRKLVEKSEVDSPIFEFLIQYMIKADWRIFHTADMQASLVELLVACEVPDDLRQRGLVTAILTGYASHWYLDRTQEILQRLTAKGIGDLRQRIFSGNPSLEGWALSGESGWRVRGLYVLAHLGDIETLKKLNEKPDWGIAKWRLEHIQWQMEIQQDSEQLLEFIRSDDSRMGRDWCLVRAKQLGLDLKRIREAAKAYARGNPTNSELEIMRTRGERFGILKPGDLEE